MAGDRVTIGMVGGAPWGFRLYGGEADPLLVAKIRKRSRAFEAGLKENDILLGINGVACHGMNHSTAMGIVDSTGHSLNMLVLRGVNDGSTIETVLKEYVSKLKPVQPSSFSKPAAPPSVSQPLQPLSNGQQHFGGALGNHLPGQAVRREEQTLTDGNTTRHITTETRTQQFGGTTLTKVTREEVSRTTDRQRFPADPQPQSQPVQRPGTWQPKRVVAAPSGVSVQHNPDRSVTMTIGFAGDKENVAPPSQSMFRVSKVSTESNVWQPTSGPPVREVARHQPQAPPSQMDYQAAMQPLTCDTGDMNGELTAHMLRRIMYDGSGSDECHTPDSPFGRKKKIFADSSFYDDPEHKYPTIEEQIKMARKVALSLMSPANVTARGHKMFIKRRQKSQKWTTDDFGHLQDTAPEYFTFEAESEEEEKYYNPNPWRPVHTWQPPSHMSPQIVHQHPHARPTSLAKPTPSPPQQQPSFVPAPPPPPPVPSGTGTWKPSAADYVDLNKRILTSEESERMRKYSQKSSHTAVSPQACFSLARDLHNMKGKGGKLFAKRRARVDKWVVDESSVPVTAPTPTPEFIKKLTGGMVPPPPADVPPPKSGPRLQQMIEMPKPAMTPWEAAQSGNVDKAFDHIDNYERQVALANMGVPPAAVAVRSAPGGFSPAPSSSAGSTNARLPDGVRKIQGWGGAGNNLLSTASNSTQSIGSAPFAASPQSVTSSVPGFRPVSFTVGQGVGDFSPSQAGVCDL